MSRRILLAGGIFVTVGGSLLPFLWFVLTSFKSQAEIEAAPPAWWPSGSLGFYRTALFDHHLFDYVLNSVVVAGSTTLVALLLAIPAAYALARLSIPGKQGILAVLLCVSMFPQMAIAGPVWRLLDALGGLNHRWGVVLPYVALTLPLAIWFSRVSRPRAAAEPASNDCETFLQAVRVQGNAVEISPHHDRVASCPPFQWDTVLFRELFE